tara:strand:- start:1303 stop:1770 length:468 start_codon:yes stop_codon:yes gene_type:complete
MSIKKVSLIIILPILSNILLSNELEKNKILNIMVDHNYELTDQKYGNLETYFCFPFLYNDSEKVKSAMSARELKKLLKRVRKELPKNHSHIDWKKMNVKVMNDNIALVNAMYSRIDKSNSNYFTGAAMYSFRKIDKKWKIFSITPFKPYNYFEFE